MEIKYCIKFPALMQPQPREEIQSGALSFFLFFSARVKDDSHQEKPCLRSSTGNAEEDPREVVVGKKRK